MNRTAKNVPKSERKESGNTLEPAKTKLKQGSHKFCYFVIINLYYPKSVFLFRRVRKIVKVTISFVTSVRRFQWPRGLRRRSTTVRLLGSWVRIPREHGRLSVMSVVCVVR